MIWNFTLFVIHIAAFVGLIFLYKAAPCWMQKVTVVLAGIGMAVLSVSFAMAAFGVWWNFYLRPAGWMFLDLGMLLFVFRLFYQKHLQWKPSSAHFPNS